MAYSTIDDLTEIIPAATIVELTDDEGAGEADQGKVAKAIAEADEEIDGYLRGRYELPFAVVPGIVPGLSASLAVFNLYARRPEIELPPTLKVRHDHTVRTLERIQKGVVSLATAAGDGPAEQGEYRTSKAAGDRTFSKTVLDGF